MKPRFWQRAVGLQSQSQMLSHLHNMTSISEHLTRRTATTLLQIRTPPDISAWMPLLTTSCLNSDSRGSFINTAEWLGTYTAMLQRQDETASTNKAAQKRTNKKQQAAQRQWCSAGLSRSGWSSFRFVSGLVSVSACKITSLYVQWLLYTSWLTDTQMPFE